jgi:hypothetical protein
MLDEQLMRENALRAPSNALSAKQRYGHLQSCFKLTLHIGADIQTR